MSAAAGRLARVRRLRLLGGYLGGQPVWCSWQLTRRCASYCLFCEHRQEGGDPELDLAGCTRVVEELGRLGSLVVSLTGGEPFLRSDLPKIVALLAGRHFPVLTTHGWLVTRSSARAVWAAGLRAASVRLSHAEPDRHDGAAGVPGAYRRALEAMAVLAETRTDPERQRLNLKLRFAEPGELDALEELLVFAADRGATVSVEPAFPVARGGSAADGSVSARLLELKARHRSLRSGRFFLERIDRALTEGVPGCRAGRAFFNVDHRGRVSKCVEFQGAEDRVADLLRDGAPGINRPLAEAHRENRCRSCWHGFRGEVEGVYTMGGLVRTLPALLRS